jgi:hypothetical protein
MKHRISNKKKEHHNLHKRKPTLPPARHRRWLPPLFRSQTHRTRRADRDLFCGICHSDLHQVRNEWSAVPTVYPIVPGHEVVGRGTKVGSAFLRETQYHLRCRSHRHPESQRSLQRLLKSDEISLLHRHGSPQIGVNEGISQKDSRGMHLLHFYCTASKTLDN